MSNNDEPSDSFRGQVEVAESAIIELVRDVVRGCYGVVGIGRSTGRTHVSRVPGLWRKSTIGISVVDGRVSVHVPVVIEYGTPVATVARNVIQTVSFHVQQTPGIPVERVDVLVSGLRRTADAESAFS